MTRRRRSVTTLMTSAASRTSRPSRTPHGAEISCSMAARRPPSAARRSLEPAAQLLGADVVFVAVLDLPAADAALVEPGAVRRAQVLDEVVAAFADDGGVLAA